MATKFDFRIMLNSESEPLQNGGMTRQEVVRDSRFNTLMKLDGSFLPSAFTKLMDEAR